MERTDRDIVEDLQLRVKELDSEIRMKQEELDALRAEKAKCLKEMGEHSDEKYQQDMLEMVYEQRMASRNKRK